MDKDEMFARISDILISQFDVDETTISMDANLYEELEIDSIDAIDLLVQMKEFTGEKIAPEAFKNVRTIRDVMNALSKL